VRICSNPGFSRDAVSPLEALSLLRQITELPEHAFWPDSVTLPKALDGLNNVLGHRQITDAYLLALAHERDATLATLDRGLLRLTPEKSRIEIPSEAGVI
jgi:predicted nucleic acid-binding protein